MEVMELKKYICDNNKIELILEQLGCHDIHYREDKEIYSAAFPDGDNPQGVNIRENNYLNYRSFSRNVSFSDKKDLISLVEYIKKISFVESLRWLHKVLQIPFTAKHQVTSSIKKININQIFIDAKASYHKVNVADVKIIDEAILDDYIPMLHISWIKEGIMSWTRKKFGIAYSYRRNRIIIPIRYFATGELLGINSRTTIPNYDLFGIKKYCLTKTYQKSMNLYGLYENYDSILKSKLVVVFESEKSVLKRDSLLDNNCVAIQGKSLSEEQTRILIGLDAEIVFALDKDVCIEDIWFMCEKFYGIRIVSYIWDDDGLVHEKESPADCSDAIYRRLLKNRKRYGYPEHQNYLRSLEK